jgi:membrane associated rhomboid family serine protease
MISNRTTDITSISGTGIEGGRFRTETTMISNRTTDDSILARALQAIEFEISSETLERREAREVERRELESGDFSQKELSASGCKGQVLTLSTFICLLQIAYLIAMIQQDGFAPSTVNPMIGPPATTLVRYGAKYAGLIVYERQWWRLISPIAVHAGIIHLISNVVIQLRVGGYLNLVYGTWKWFTIYLLSGIYMVFFCGLCVRICKCTCTYTEEYAYICKHQEITDKYYCIRIDIYGEIMSCIVLPNSVGVGSSGSLYFIVYS